jgi:5-methylcytosine-specific restriction endonuclease McrA
VKTKRGSNHIKAQKEGKERDQNVCQLCGAKEKIEGHHIINFAYGGAATADNIISLCKRCHQAVHKGKVDITIF